MVDAPRDTTGKPPSFPGAESGRNELKKATYPSVVGIVQATERLQELLKLCDRQLVSFGESAEPLRAIAEHIIARSIPDRGRAAEESIS
jgi:radical SAM superfamily enzyme YgiQ (UPF0313 family)